MQLNGDNVYIALHCEGKFVEIDVKKFVGLNGFGFTKNQNRLAILGIVPTNLQDIFPVFNTIKFLIERTYPIIEKI